MGSRLLATAAWQAESITQTAAESKCQVQDLVHDLLVTQFAGGESANGKRRILHAPLVIFIQFTHLIMSLLGVCLMAR